MTGTTFAAANSGMYTNQRNIDAAAKNLASANAHGYKAIKSNISNYVTQGSEVAGGSVSIISQTVDQQGSREQTGVETDLVVSGGDSFFVLENKEGEHFLSSTVSMRQNAAGLMEGSIKWSSSTRMEARWRWKPPK